MNNSIQLDYQKYTDFLKGQLQVFYTCNINPIGFNKSKQKRKQYKKQAVVCTAMLLSVFDPILFFRQANSYNEHRYQIQRIRRL